MIIFHKQKGETPLSALNRLRLEKPELKDERLSYAGRLDPMAEGVLLVLVGDENNDREKYLGLNKTYQTDILLGLSTDTGDILGIPQNIKLSPRSFLGESGVDLGMIDKILDSFKSKFEQKYPAFSSKTVSGKPLFLYAREGLPVPEVKHTVEVFDIKILALTDLNSKDLLSRVENDVSLVFGDFRQEDVLEKFRNELIGQDFVFKVLSLELSVSSGFYIRQFAMDLGDRLGVPALALNIKRIRVGDYT